MKFANKKASGGMVNGPIGSAESTRAVTRKKNPAIGF
jgi:hypothetical protein